MLATNTSSLSVTALAAGVPGPERVVGMHFFNPPPIMQLLEVVAGERSGEAALARARAAGEAMGKHVIDAADGAGFLVNRCNRPFALEGLRLVEQRVATPEQVDRICRMAGGFRMGPFELMDLVGVDVGFTISKSFFEQSFGEPRWRPSPLGRPRGGGGPPRAQDRRGLVPLPRRAAGRPGAARARRRRRARRDRRGRASPPPRSRPAATGAGWDVAAPKHTAARRPFADRRVRRGIHDLPARRAPGCSCATRPRSPPGTPAARAPASTCCRPSAASPS